VVELSRVHPNKGPQSGGTRLYLIGANLNVGSQLQVLLDDIPCEVDRTLASNSQISCRTTKSPIPSYNVSLLRLSVDNALLTLPNPFVYRDDPIVKKITPLKSFVSGGRAVTVSGVNFLPVQQPRMVVYFNDSLVNETVCFPPSCYSISCSNLGTFTRISIGSPRCPQIRVIVIISGDLQMTVTDSGLGFSRTREDRQKFVNETLTLKLVL
ncbi:Plexin-B, partial [Araneus ventricosus]